MDKQTFFNITAERLIKQGKPAYDDDIATCVYRTETGLKCGVGQHIPADEYSPDMEENNASGMFHMSPTLSRIAEAVSPKFMDIIQTAHDGGNYMDYNADTRIEYPENLRQSAGDDNDWLNNFKGRMFFIADWFNLDSSILR
jgi:hypothetical protein